jgi:hypothetical protein
MSMLRSACTICTACIYYIPYMYKPVPLLSHPILFKSRNRSQIKPKWKMSMLFPYQNFMFFPMVHLVLVYCKSHIMHRKMNTAIHGNCASIQPPFPHIHTIGLNLQENRVHHSKERTILVRKQRIMIMICHVFCICTWFLPLKDLGRHIYIQAGMHAYKVHAAYRTGSRNIYYMYIYIPYIHIYMSYVPFYLTLCQIGSGSKSFVQ